MELEVLVATMGQKDLSLGEKMNIKRDAVIANQCGSFGYAEQRNEKGTLRMISTATKGVGTNRNLALELAKGDVLLFADDDIVYYDDLQPVVEAFRELPKADVIFFAMDMTREGKVFDKRRHKRKRLHLWNSMKYGAARMAVRREAVEKNRLRFSTLFGGGSLYCSGEDSIFIRDCLKKGLRLYSHEHVLGACAKDSSSWFRGYDEKYFFDRGALIAASFPKLKHLVKWYYIFKFAKKTELSRSAVIRRINEGIRAYPQQKGFEA